MGIIEKRKNPRVSTVNLISYAGTGEGGDSLDQGMGKALDIGQGGLLMETSALIQAQYILLTSMNVNEELIKVKGRVVYCREIEPGVFHAPIICSHCVQKILGYEVVINTTYNAVRADLRAKRGSTHTQGRVCPKIMKCPYCGCVYFAGNPCPMCGK